MKHKRQTLSKTDDDDSNKDDLKDDDSQSCSKFFSPLASQHINLIIIIGPTDSNSKKSCQGCELPSDDIPDSTSNSRGHNNNTPSATNNNNNGIVNSTNSIATPNSSLDLGTPPNTSGLNTTSIISADSSVASSMDDEEDTPVKIKKKDENHVSNIKHFYTF